ncbi:hypothetical protein AU381_24820 [Sinorhizobium glycinis]|uniref:Uncharacterized protein n=1 Tax=Sinorhizobium glycinis TaxID=1472378 RepID=A0A178XH77_9HYPH|nr:hypothetical protein [Sinorhizobium glycinis]OAP34551.1 hypothetical protein AU381_24820 [Sinorhizobium glycinis]
MTALKLHASRALGIAIALTVALIDLTGFSPAFSFVGSAEARIGRPLTPVSVAGVARRTTRRVIRRTAVTVAALPAGCVCTYVNGARVWRCGSAYYQPYRGSYVVVVFD